MATRITVCGVNDIPDGCAAVVRVNDADVAVFNSGGKFFALADACPHAGAALSGGLVEDGTVTCPWHGWRFRLSDGAWVDSPKVKTTTYPVTTADGLVKLEVPDGAAD